MLRLKGELYTWIEESRDMELEAWFEEIVDNQSSMLALKREWRIRAGLKRG